MKERTILLHGFSQGFAMTGFRVGFACGPDWLIEAMMKIHRYCMMCAPILSQEAAVEALRHGTGDVIRMKKNNIINAVILLFVALTRWGWSATLRDWFFLCIPKC